MWFEVKPLALQLMQGGYAGNVKLRAKFVDQTSREYVSEPFVFDIHEWIKQ